MCLCKKQRRRERESNCKVDSRGRKRSAMASTKERENFVYVAKLAEQAERYDGFSLSLTSLSFLVIPRFFFFLLFGC